ncbi:hypothetical protein LG634_01115 [Streptomyces bambusae]|uniref:hypothetical protein n=1 Tax=Streptomyces bambusae TaxID=1550616 RepID=UPI001CFD26FD|nr:hypothetical protein [Streptomyces bambusae]MCB5163453.1 hypothetical protein [Streptomyces bambusae]
MRSLTLTRKLLVPALTSLALAATGCTAAGTADAAPPAPATEAAAAASPAPGHPAGAGEQLAVRAAPQHTPTAVARPAGARTTAERSPLKVASYDKKTRRAVISTAQHRTSGDAGSDRAAAGAGATAGAGGAGATAGPAAGAGRPVEPVPPAQSAQPVKTGDVIASAPAPGAPQGLLAEVTDIVRTTDRGTEVVTKPATLDQVLADDEAAGQVPVDPSTVQVVPLLEGVKFSWTRPDGVHFGPNGVKVPAGNLRLDVETGIETAADAPVSAAASAAGYVQLAPEVEFSYDGSPGRIGPGAAFLGMSGDWSAHWNLKGRVSAQATQRIPLARLHADPVIQVGPVPVVVNLGLTVYLQVQADGRITVDVTQDVKGDFRVGGSYAFGKGWSPVGTSQVTSTPVTASVTAAGRAKASLGTEASVGLYGLVGLTADFAPYVRGEAQLTGTASSDGKAQLTGAWSLHGGFDLSGHLSLQLRIFGTPVFEKRIPLGTLTREWPLTQGTSKLTA